MPEPADREGLPALDVAARAEPPTAPDLDDLDDLADLAALDALAAAAREVAVGPRIGADLPAFLDAHRVVDPQRRALLDAGPAPLLMYRAMVRGRLRRVLREFLPRALARLGDARLRADFAAFFAERGTQSVVLRDVPVEFVRWAAPRWRADPALPDYLVDLARHELLASELRHHPGGGEPPTGRPLALDRPLRFDGAVVLRRYDHAVHRLAADDDDPARAPDREDTVLLAYRDRRAHTVRTLELTQRAGAVLDRLLAGAPVEAALRGAAAALGQPLDDDFLAGMVHLFADLSEREIILGAEPSLP